MKKHCLVYLGTGEEELKRMEFIHKWLGEHSLNVDVGEISVHKSEVAKQLKSLMTDEKTTSIRISHELAEEAYKALALQKTAESMVHQQIEAIVCTEGKWWPRCFGAEALIELIRHSTKALDCSARGMVVGDNSFVRVALYVLSQLGYHKLDLISSDQKIGQATVESFRRRNFGLELRLIDPAEITMQSSEASILINTFREEQDPELIEDLSYFNFLKANGLVIDLYPSLRQNRLIREAKEVGMEVIAGQRLQARIDFLWLADLYPELEGQWENYLRPWLAHWDELLQQSTEVEKQAKESKRTRPKS